MTEVKPVNPPAAPTQRPRTPVLVAASLVTLLAVVASVFAVIFGLNYFDAKDSANQLKQAEADRNGAQQFACSFTSMLATYDYNSMDSLLSNVLNQTTGDLHDAFAGDVGQNLKDRVTKEKVNSTAQATCGSVSSQDGHFQVMTVVQQQITSQQTGGKPQPLPPNPMVLTAVKVGGQWKAADLEGTGPAQ